MIWIGVMNVKISQEAMLKKMKEAMMQAEKHMHTDQFEVSIGKLHVLCELLLDEPKELSQLKQAPVKSDIEAVYAQKESSIHAQKDEELKEDSIFDF